VTTPGPLRMRQGRHREEGTSTCRLAQRVVNGCNPVTLSMRWSPWPPIPIWWTGNGQARRSHEGIGSEIRHCRAPPPRVRAATAGTGMSPEKPVEAPGGPPSRPSRPHATMGCRPDPTRTPWAVSGRLQIGTAPTGPVSRYSNRGPGHVEDTPRPDHPVGQGEPVLDRARRCGPRRRADRRYISPATNMWERASTWVGPHARGRRAPEVPGRLVALDPVRSRASPDASNDGAGTGWGCSAGARGDDTWDS